jgi:citrate synthase
MPSNTAKDIARLTLGEKEIELDVITGSEGERAVNILPLRKETGLITMDPGYGNTGACTSAITFLNGEKGILRHRGYSIEDLAAHSTFDAVAYLLLHGELPTPEEYRSFEKLLQDNYAIEPEILKVMESFPAGTHPMAVLGGCLLAMSGMFPDYGKETIGGHDSAIVRILAKMPGLTAGIYRLRHGKKPIEADPSLSYAENFLHMMFGEEEKDVGERFKKVRALSLDNLLVIHADHEQNCSTSTVRMVQSANTNVFASVAAGVTALWGPLHGGANQAVMEMLQTIQQEHGDLAQTIARAKDKSDPFRLMGFGHRVYKTYDPRARIAKKALAAFLDELGLREPLVDIAIRLEQCALEDPYFQERNLYPNVDFYTGILYRAMGIPTELFTVLFALGRMSGYLAHVVEFYNDPMRRIGRPRQIYTGHGPRPFPIK